MPEFPPDNPRNVLIVKPSALGDIVHALPVAALVKRRWPAAEVSWLVSRPFAPLLETNPHIADTIAFDRERGGGMWRQSSAARRLARDLRRRRFDLVIDLQGLFRSGWLTWQTRAPVRIGFGYAREGAPMFYTRRVAARPGERHAIDRYLDIAETLGLGRGPVEFPLVTTVEDRDDVDALLSPLDGQAFALLFPGTNWATKRWPAEKYAALAARLDHELGLRPVVAGGADAAEAAAVVLQRHPRSLDLTGKTGIRPLVGLIHRASLVVCNDSGPMHLAAALGVPMVTLFGPTSPARTGPFGRGRSVLRLDIVCSPCFSRDCVHQSCLQQLEGDAVLDRCRTELADHAVAGSSASTGSGGTM